MAWIYLSVAGRVVRVGSAVGLKYVKGALEGGTLCYHEYPHDRQFHLPVDRTQKPSHRDDVRGVDRDQGGWEGHRGVLFLRESLPC